MRPTYEVADVIERNTSQLDDLVPNRWNRRTLYAIASCRTARLGWHLDKCTNKKCGNIHISYNSCRNRHCPKCQGHKREEWIRAREAELLKVPYYHVVFTLPQELNSLCLYEPEEMYHLLFKTAWSVIKGFAANAKFLGAATGMVAILHTWGQNLSLHPHLHCIVPGGGVTAGNKWKQARGRDKYLFPVKAMSKVFSAQFVEGLRKTELSSQLDFKQLFDKNWVVYCKRPFFGPTQVVEYLGRYTHKIAISNHRIKSIDNYSVTFSAKDYRHAGKKYPVTLTDAEFIRRFAMHILPKGFTRIRHYGILSNSLKKAVIDQVQQELGVPDLPQRPPLKHRLCYHCGVGKLLIIAVFKSRGPPWYSQSKAFKKRKSQN